MVAGEVGPNSAVGGVATFSGLGIFGRRWLNFRNAESAAFFNVSASGSIMASFSAELSLATVETTSAIAETAVATAETVVATVEIASADGALSLAAWSAPSRLFDPLLACG